MCVRVRLRQSILKAHELLLKFVAETDEPGAAVVLVNTYSSSYIKYARTLSTLVH